MSKTTIIQQQTEQISTVEDLTGVFESIASTQVAKIKDRVVLSKEFFDLLWARYTSIRIDPKSQISRRSEENKSTKEVFVIISAEAGLSGDIDHRLIETMLNNYNKETTDIVVLGSHGANELKQRGIPYRHYFQIPVTEGYIDVSPVIDAISPYSKIKVYYEEYVSLGVQGIKTIDLLFSIKAMGDEADANNENIISDRDTIFEPSLDEIAELMENTMMRLAFSQAILESSLAQDASRFNAMAVAKKRAFELLRFYFLEYNRAKRYDSDRRLHEIMISIKKKKRSKQKK